MRAVACAALLLTATGASAQAQRPLPAGAPDALVTASISVSVVASEDLEPDALRAFARPRVTLWLTTRSNTLRRSTVESLGRFDHAWVQVRAPLSRVDARVLEAVPRVGVWLHPGDVAGVLGRAPGARRVALDLDGPLDAAAESTVRAARPSVLRWIPGGPVDLLSWSRFAQLPGRKVFVPPPDGASPAGCGTPAAQRPAVELHLATLLAMGADVFPCGPGTRVVLTSQPEPWLLRSLIVRDPAIELVLDVGADEGRAAFARRLLADLGLGPGR